MFCPLILKKRLYLNIIMLTLLTELINQIMKLIISFAISLLTISGLFSQEIIGTWQGTLKTQGVELEVVFHIDKQDDGYVSLMDSPTQGAFGIPVTNTSFQNEQLQIVLSNLGIFFQGKMNNDTITGMFNQGGMPFPPCVSTH